MRKTFLYFLVFALLTVPFVSFAATLLNPLADAGINSIYDFLEALLNLIIQIAFPIIILFIIFIGFRFVQHSAEGNAEELKKDRNYFLWALVGALILLGAQALSLAIQGTIGQLSSGL